MKSCRSSEGAFRTAQIWTSYRATARQSGLLAGVLGGTVGTVVLNVTTTALNFALTLVLSRALGATGYGAYAFAFAWATVLTAPAVLGLTPLVVRTVSTYHTRAAWPLLRGILRRANQVVGGASLSLAAFAALAGWLLMGSDPELRDPFWIALLLVPVLALTSVRQAAMQGLGRVLAGRLPETVVAPGLFLTLVGTVQIVAPHRLTASSALLVQLGAAGVAFALGAYLLRRTLPRDARASTPAYEMREWRRSALPLLVLSGVMAVNAQVGTIFLGAVSGPKEAGVYAVASRIAIFASFISLAATYPLMPAVARLHASGESRALQRLLTSSSRGVLLVTLPIGALLLALAPHILGFFGDEFTVGSSALRLIVGGEVARVALGFAGLALVMSGREAHLAKGVAVGAAINIALNAMLVPFWGVEGAAVAVAVSVVASSAVLAVMAWRELAVYAPALGLPSAMPSRDSSSY